MGVVRARAMMTHCVQAAKELKAGQHVWEFGLSECIQGLFVSRWCSLGSVQMTAHKRETACDQTLLDINSPQYGNTKGDAMPNTSTIL